jgi:aminoglycoside/choline kinase family phosphotransferase
MPQRIQALKNWLSSLPMIGDFSFEPASGDASFRRYFRIGTEGGSYIAMDAPPEKEPLQPFLQIARSFESIGLNVPHIHAENHAEGFLLLGDLGSVLYLDRLDDATVETLYDDALNALVRIQANAPTQGLPEYDRALLMREMELFREWLVARELGLTLTVDEQEMLDETFEMLVASALSQPQVCVHRDYHSRNLMVTQDNNPGILDFQDAVVGPVTYDLVSLLRDCYISWPRARVEAWVEVYFEQALQSGVLLPEHKADFLTWFDLMGVQRHLKASGIFARLNQRDGKPGYLADIPRTLAYIVSLDGDYPGIAGLAELIRARVVPRLNSH